MTALPEKETVAEEKPARLLVLWTRPADEAAFEADYRISHMPLIGGLPGVDACVSSRLRSKRFHRIAELQFSSLEALTLAMSSPAGQKLSADSRRIAAEYGVESISVVALAPDIVASLAEKGPSLDAQQD
jgi:uncharacterized protein (TIGR02118 family)